MVKPEEIEVAVNILKGYGARRVVLFGSAVDRPESANDIDLACEGIAPALFYAAVGALLNGLNRDVDLVDLMDNPRRSALIERTGRTLYVQQ